MKKKFKEATKVIMKIAKWNGKLDQMDEKEVLKGLIDLANDPINIQELTASTMMISTRSLASDIDRKNKETGSFLDVNVLKSYAPTLLEYLLNPMRNALNLLIVIYIAISTCMLYFGATIGKKLSLLKSFKNHVSDKL